MSGGLAYVYDEDGQFHQRCNMAMVALETLPDRDDTLVKKLIEDHHRWTGSRRARDILDHWGSARAKFVKVFPNEYRRALAELEQKKLSVKEKVAV
jgi:glutamate synthase domain-containing protein 3